MGHPGFTSCVLLAAAGVAWSEVVGWTPARREAALIVLGEAKGGRFNRRTWQMEWPE
jgi:hypothetical protein